MNKRITHFIIIWIMLGSCLTTMGQPPRGPFIISPQVNPDKTVTFRYLAPPAKVVKLSGQFLAEPMPMTKDTLGIWSVTVGPIKPDIYPYSFQVDGVTVMDPANVSFFPNERFKASLVDVPGETPLVHEMRDVPHGKITYEYYPSVEGITGNLHTPRV
jgi:1,4-alpha-glucan branching enzyme